MDENAKKILLIVNPAAGKGRTGMLIQDFSGLFTERFETTVYTTKGRGDATNIAAHLPDKYDYVICRGGDGTFHEVVNGIMKLDRRRPLGYIPSGTTNDLAKSLGIPVQTMSAIDTILEGRLVKHDLGLFNAKTYFTYTASFGAFTRASYDTPQDKKNSLGRLAYLSEAAREIKEIKPVHMRVESGDTTIDGNFVFGAVSNSVSVAKVIKFKRETVNLNDGRFEVLLIKNPGSLAGWRSVLDSVLRRQFTDKNIMFFHTDNISFTSDSGINWTLDGEYGGCVKKAQIEVVNNAIEIFRNKNAIC